jgi:hypothetical protein
LTATICSSFSIITTEFKRSSRTQGEWTGDSNSSS